MTLEGYGQPFQPPADVNAVSFTSNIHAATSNQLRLLCSTACTSLDLEEVELAHRVKVILDKQGYAMYFSRGVLPSNKSSKAKTFPPPFQDQPYLLHLGIACFDRDFLRKYCQLPATPCMVSVNKSEPSCVQVRLTFSAPLWCSLKYSNQTK